MPGTPRRQWWWEQELSLDEDEPTSAYSSDGSDFSEESASRGEGGAGWVDGRALPRKKLCGCSSPFKTSFKSLGVAGAQPDLDRSKYGHGLLQPETKSTHT